MSMSAEMDAWLARQQVAAETKARRTATDGNVAPFPLTDAEFAWLWPRFQKCRFGSISAASSFVRTDLDRVTLRGKAFALRMAFRHRTQIFGRPARKIALDEFLGAIRTAAAKVKSL